MKIVQISVAALAFSILCREADAGETPKAIIELFTSQGCSSCPPANEFVGELADDPDKLVLSYGVTYWDFLGWEDTFADPKFTDRQRLYGETLDMGYVYTPQIVLNGRHHNSRYTIGDIEKARFTPTAINLDLSQKDGQLFLIGADDGALIVSFKPGWHSIDVKRGENHGRKLRVSNVVTDVQSAENGKTPILVKQGLAYAALVHDPDSNQIIAASVLRP
ncbi:MAG: DUF1223 domain-containing protein [Hellea sp.]|nr:DUF1223 domain-containing protein [Hellea sp.]